MEKRVENWNQVHSYNLQLNSYESTVYSDIKHKIQKKVSFTSFTM